MTTLTEVIGSRRSEALVAELPGDLSRKTGVVASGEGVLSANTVLALNAGGKYVELNPAAVDGTENAVAILFDEVDATSADAPCVVFYKDAAFNADEVVYPSGITGPQTTTAIADLALVGIVLR